MLKNTFRNKSDFGVIVCACVVYLYVSWCRTSFYK